MNIDDLVGGLEYLDYFSIQSGISWSHLTNSYFSEGLVYHQPVKVMLEKTWEYDDRGRDFEVQEFQAKPTISNDSPLETHLWAWQILDPLSLGAVGSSQMGSLMEPLSAFSNGRHWMCSRCANFPRGLRHGPLWTLWLWWGEGSHPISGAGIATWSVSACLTQTYGWNRVQFVYDMFMICLWYVYGWKVESANCSWWAPKGMFFWGVGAIKLV